MKIVLGLLNQLLGDDLSVTQVSEALERAGIEVEGVIHPPDFDSNIVTATIKDIKPHPNADRLNIAIVTCRDEQLEVICGASNIRKGQRVVLARIGAELPGGHKINQTEIRGKTSHGMICSEQELGLGSDHDGILELGDEVEEGLPLSEVYSSDQIVIDTTTAANRWDLQGYRGVAREVSAHTGVALTFEGFEQLLEKEKHTDDLFANQLQEEVPEYCLTKLKIKDASIPSPSWMQNYLRLHSIKPVSAVVDITNFVMLETGQPLHAFDAGEIKGKVNIRFAENEEKITTLDGTERMLGSSDLVIADDKELLALAGVMGSEDSEITAKTKEVLLEAASFDSTLVRKTAKRNGLRSEASSRFERGLPLQAVKVATHRALELLKDITDAELVSYQSERTAWPWIQHVGVRVTSLNSFLGLELSKEEIVESLQPLGFDAEKFDIKEQASKLLDKPYKLGARFKTDGTDAFDCSYLTDYIYSLIGIAIGHTAHQQYENGEAIDIENLTPGDLLFRGGPWVELDEKERDGVSHVAIYVGGDTIIEARDYIRREDGEWQKLPEKDRYVIEQPLSAITEDPQFMGARRYAENLDDYIRVTVPWWRPDVSNSADVYEEVIKIVGLENLPSTLPNRIPTDVRPDIKRAKVDSLRNDIKASGLYEVTTYPFISHRDIEVFAGNTEEHLKLKNPRSSEQAYLRRSLLPGLVNSVVNNTTIEKEFGFFEFARIFHAQLDEILPEEKDVVGIVCIGENSLSKVKGVLDHIISTANLQVRYISSDERTDLHPGRQAAMEVNGEPVGLYGELHPLIATKKKLKNTVACAEINLESLLRLWSAPDFEPIPRLQSSYRDVTFVAPEDVQWQDIADHLDRITNVNFDFQEEYRDKNGRSITVNVEILAVDKTLTDRDIESKMKEIFAVLEGPIGAKVDK